MAMLLNQKKQRKPRSAVKRKVTEITAATKKNIFERPRNTKSKK
jgi:hypothetical protein